MVRYFISSIILSVMLLGSYALQAQDTGSFLENGQLYGEVFGDLYYKGNADSLARGDYQYSGIPANGNGVGIRRIYLGYKYHFSPRFTANILFEAEVIGGKTEIEMKYANLEWANIWQGSNLVVGQMKTPTFALTGKAWGYRAVERTLADFHGSPSSDLGIGLNGVFDAKEKFGYALMIGNGRSRYDWGDRLKKFYGSLYAKLFDKHLWINLYGDYERLHWEKGYHQSMQMWKGLMAYKSDLVTVGVEAYTQNLKNSSFLRNGTNSDTIDTHNFAISAFVTGEILPGKLGYFARFDYYNPVVKMQQRNIPITGLIDSYDPANKNIFVTTGLDFRPTENVHIMPNIWWNTFKSTRDLDNTDDDLVYRLTFFYEFES